MDLRMLERRSLNGSMTVVGDIAQATGAWAHDNWYSILDHLSDRLPPRQAELTIGYRIPEPIMVLAARVLAEAAPDLAPPSSVRSSGDSPRFVSVELVHDGLAEVVTEELSVIGAGNLAVIVASSQVDEVEAALDAAEIVFGRPTRRGLDGLRAEVHVVRTEMGVPHIYAGNRDDLLRARHDAAHGVAQLGDKTRHAVRRVI